ncbi:MAG: NAAT family transporter [Cyanobacteria bacterium J003]|uniref:MarC family protein n=1 Tax=Thermosynechococcus sp. M3746_W2019_013 TaxID=2747806 RepID=UPI000F11E8EC|nr:NAAT family transporter [Thermosynechococcus sp. M3746_W2019_013]RMH66278.1 MAG: NAAT family transporter [Cyanobacteria bacterium J003]HIK24047.1 NAAT family transporter [Thermosynechococcus sp. M3746_W2019_013]
MEPLLSYLVGAIAALFPIVDPIGAIPIFYALTAKQSHQRRCQQAKQVALNVAAVLTVFFLMGKGLLAFFGISLPVVRIAGGLIVSHTAWQMVTSQDRLTHREQTEAADKADISLTPMAVPLLSGPGAIAMTISLSTRCHTWLEYLGVWLGILLLSAMVYFLLILGEPLSQAWGITGRGALTRLLGFFILAIAVQFIADGSLALLQPLLR